MQDNDSNIVIYQTPDGETRVDVRLEGDTVWLSQAEIALLYNTDRTSISRHIRNIYNSEELDEVATCAKFAQVRFEGKRRIERTICTYDLYLTVKNHSFSDGNKRIAAFLFLWFLEKNGILYRQNRSPLLDNNTLVALTLMIAESDVSEKDIMTKVIVNLINHNN